MKLLLLLLLLGQGINPSPYVPPGGSNQPPPNWHGPTATLGVPFSLPIPAMKGATSCSVVNYFPPFLPHAFSISNSGVITGTPNKQGMFHITTRCSIPPNKQQTVATIIYVQPATIPKPGVKK